MLSQYAASRACALSEDIGGRRAVCLREGCGQVQQGLQFGERKGALPLADEPHRLGEVQIDARHVVVGKKDLQLFLACLPRVAHGARVLDVRLVRLHLFVERGQFLVKVHKVGLHKEVFKDDGAREQSEHAEDGSQ